MTYYAYVHAKPLVGGAEDIFYVGKGLLGRVKDTFNRNAHYKRVVVKYGQPAIGKIECSSEHVAFDLEKGLIKCLRRMGVVLANQTDGGEGASGAVRSEETKQRMRIAAKARPGLSELAERMREWARANNIRMHLGRKRPAETGVKIAAALTGRKLAESHKQATSAGHLAQEFRWMRKDTICEKVPGSLVDSKLAQGFVFGRITKRSKIN